MPIADAWGEMNICICLVCEGWAVGYALVQRWSGAEGVLAREICCRSENRVCLALDEVDHFGSTL